MSDRYETDYDYLVKLEFPMPRSKEELDAALKGGEYKWALEEIYNMCRNVWKYQGDATEQEIALAREIADRVAQAGL